MSKNTEYANAAMVISEIYEARNKESFVKKTLQKTVYLAQQKGAELGYGFTLHFYGPYSAQLDTDTLCLQAYGEVFCDYQPNGHFLEPNKPEISVLGEPTIDDTTLELVHSVAARYKDWSPSLLELLATAIYAYKHLDNNSKENIISKVRHIKGEKYSDAEISKVLNEFEFFGIFLD